MDEVTFYSYRYNGGASKKQEKMETYLQCN